MVISHTFWQRRFGGDPAMVGKTITLNNRAFTVKLVSNASWTARPWLNLKTTGGADYLNNESDFSRAGGSTLPPSAQTVSAGAVKSASDGQQSATKTFGVYVQEQASIRDRMYLTAAVRSTKTARSAPISNACSTRR